MNYLASIIPAKFAAKLKEKKDCAPNSYAILLHFEAPIFLVGTAEARYVHNKIPIKFPKLFMFTSFPLFLSLGPGAVSFN